MFWAGAFIKYLSALLKICLQFYRQWKKTFTFNIYFTLEGTPINIIYTQFLSLCGMLGVRDGGKKTLWNLWWVFQRLLLVSSALAVVRGCQRTKEDYPVTEPVQHHFSSRALTHSVLANGFSLSFTTRDRLLKPLCHLFSSWMIFNWVTQHFCQKLLVRQGGTQKYSCGTLVGKKVEKSLSFLAVQ